MVLSRLRFGFSFYCLFMDCHILLSNSTLWWLGMKMVVSLCCSSITQQCSIFLIGWSSSSPCLMLKLHWHDLYITFTSILIYSVIFQELIEHLLPCFRHLARVAPSLIPLCRKRDHQRRLIDLFANEGLQHVNDELGSIVNVDRIHSLVSLIFKIMCNLWKIQFIFDLFPLKSSTYCFLRVIKCSRANIWLRGSLFIGQIIWIKCRNLLLWVCKWLFLKYDFSRFLYCKLWATNLFSALLIAS